MTEEVKIEKTPREKFVELVEERVPKALERIRIIGNVSNSKYEYNAVDVEEIVSTLRTAVDELEERLIKRPNGKTMPKFKLSS